MCFIGFLFHHEHNHVIFPTLVTGEINNIINNEKGKLY